MSLPPAAARRTLGSAPPMSPVVGRERGLGAAGAKDRRASCEAGAVLLVSVLFLCLLRIIIIGSSIMIIINYYYYYYYFFLFFIVIVML